MQAKKKKKKKESAFLWRSGQKVYVQNTFDFFVVIAEAVKEETSNTVFARSQVWERRGLLGTLLLQIHIFFLFFLKSREWLCRTSRSLSAVHKRKACSPPTPHLLYLQRTSWKTKWALRHKWKQEVKMTQTLRLLTGLASTPCGDCGLFSLLKDLHEMWRIVVLFRDEICFVIMTVWVLSHS